MSEQPVFCQPDYSKDIAMSRVFGLLEGDEKLYILKNEDGTEMHYVFLDVIEFENRIYAAMFVQGQDPNKFSIFSVSGSEGDEQDFSFVEEAGLKDSLFDIFKVRNQGVYELTQ